MKFDFVAPCYFGTESAAAFDFKRIGAENVAVTDGRVSFSGGADTPAAEAEKSTALKTENTTPNSSTAATTIATTRLTQLPFTF